MPITSISEIHRGRGGVEERTGLKAHTRIFQVITDEARIEQEYIWQFSVGIIPQIGDEYQPLLSGIAGLLIKDSRSFCVRRRADQQEDRHTWYVFCDYEPTDNELRPKMSVRWEKKKKALTGVRAQVVDANGQATDPDPNEPGQKKVFLSLIANSFGEAFDPAPEGEVSFPVVTIKRVEPGGLSLPKLMYYRDAVNDSMWGPVPPRCAKIMSMASEEEYRTVNSIEKKIWWCTYEIGLDPDTWDIIKLDAGFHYYTETGHAEGAGKKKTFLDEDGNPRQGLLDNEERLGTGTQDGIALVDLTTPQFKRFRFYPERDLYALGLPTDLNAILPPATI